MNAKGSKTFLTNWTSHTTYLLIHKLKIYSVTLSKETLLVFVFLGNLFFFFLFFITQAVKKKKLTFLKENHKGLHIRLEPSCLRISDWVEISNWNDFSWVKL